jgi:hypothetical protein
MKTPFYQLLVLAGISIPLTAFSDIKLNAPGQSGQTVNYLTVNEVPFESHNNAENKVLLPAYKFVLRGIEAQISTADGGKSPLNMEAMVQYEGRPDTKERVDMTLKAKNGGSNTLTGQYILTTPMEFKGLTGPVNIIVSWVGAGNAKKPAGYFNILGEYQPTPPKPTGSLSLPALVAVLDSNATAKVTGTANVIWE